MIAKLAGGLAKIVLALVGMALLTAAALFVVAAFLATWPILRLPPRQRHMRAVLELATAGAGVLAAFKAGGLEGFGAEPASSSSSDEPETDA